MTVKSLKPAIIGIGTALPAQSLAQQQACELSEIYAGSGGRKMQVLKQIYRRSGIDDRFSVLLDEGPRQSAWQEFYRRPGTSGCPSPTTGQRMQRYEQEVVDLAVQACLNALDDAGQDKRQITHLITISCTGFFAPGLDIGLIGKLELSRRVSRFNLGFMGCHGAFNGLQLARSVVAADSRARVLLCAAELCSLHYQYGQVSDNLVANALFADGAAAVVVAAAHNGQGKYVLQAGYSNVLPDSQQAMTWKIADNGFNMTLSAAVPDLIAANLPLWLESCLAQSELSAGDIKAWAVHPGGKRILDAVQQCLNLSAEDLSASREILRRCGNMSSPTVLFILQEIARKNRPAPCLLLGFGPGLTMECVVLT